MSSDTRNTVTRSAADAASVNTAGDDTAAPSATSPESARPPFGPPANPSELGRLGKYRIQRELGRGGMGAVYLAFDERLQRKVALKVMLPKAAANATAKDRFLREARAAAQISSDHVVSIYEADEIDGVPFIALQYLQGYPLDEYLKKKGLPTVPQVIRLGRETALGLAAAHRLGLVHRDIKPGNVWLEAPSGRVKILDFGLAKPVVGKEQAELTASGAIVGTPAYMAPEQGLGKPLDGRADLFSLGVMLYRLTAGRLPFEGPTLMAILTAIATEDPPPVRTLNPQVHEPLADLIHRLLAKNPADRPASATEVVKALDEMSAATKKPAAVDPDAPTVSQPLVYTPMAVTVEPSNPFEHLADEEPSSAVEPAPKPAPKRGKAPPWPLIAAAAGFAFLLVAGLAGFIIIKITNKDGSTTEIKVPEGSKIEVGGKVVTPGSEAKKPDAKPAGKDDPDRRVAEWVFRVSPANPDQPAWVDVGRGPVFAATDLPDGPFKLQALRMPPTADWLTGADPLAGLHLRQVELAGGLTDEQAAALAGTLAKVRADRIGLRLQVTPNTDAAVRSLSAVGGRLYSLEVHILSSLTADAVATLRQKCPELGNLALCGPGVTDDALAPLAAFVSLRGLQVTGSKVTDGGVKKLAAALPECKITWDGGAIGPRATAAAGLPAGKAGLRFEPKDEAVAVKVPLRPTTVVTVEAWVTFEAVQEVGGREFIHTPNGDINTDDARLRVYSFHGHATAGDRIPLGRRVHVAAVNDGKKRHLYLDGKRVAESDDAGGPVPENEVLAAGDKFKMIALGSPLFTGTIDAVRVSTTAKYEKDFTPPETLTKDKDTFALYLFDEGQGDTLKDSSGNGYHAKITGAKWVKGEASTADRAAAEWLVARKAHGFGINTPTGYASVKAGEPLPQETTALITANLFRDRSIPAEEFKRFSGLPLFSTLVLNETNAGDAHLANLGELPALAKVYLYQTAVTDEGLRHLARYPKLDLLHLTDTAVTDAGLKTLAEFRNLRELQIGSTKVTRDGVLALAKALPQCKIEWDGGVIEPKVVANSDPDRRAAEFILQFPRDHAIAVQIDDVDRWIGKAEDLPKGPFRLTSVFVEWAKTLDDAALANFAGCRHIKVLKLWGTPVTGKGLAHFAECRGLTELSLTTDTVTNAALKVFEPCEKIERLRIQSRNVTDEGMVVFRGRRLKSLALRHTPIGDRTLDLFPDSPDLELLDLGETKITDAGLKNFAKCKRIEELALFRTGVTDAGLAHFAGCTQLKRLVLAGCPGVTDGGVKELVRLTKLAKLDLQKTKVTAAGLDVLKKALPQCRIEHDGGSIEPTAPDDRAVAEWIVTRRKPEFTLLVDGKDVYVTENAKLPSEPFRIRGFRILDSSIVDDDLDRFTGLTELAGINLHTCSITNTGVAKLAVLPKLIELNLERTKVTEAVLPTLRKFPKLSNLVLNDLPITDEGLKQLAEISSLDTLSIQRTKVTEAGVKKLAAAMPKCKIEWDGGTIEPKK